MAANPRVDMRRLQEWMGHANITTTLRYAHFRPRHDDAALVAEAFAIEQTPPTERDLAGI